MVCDTHLEELGCLDDVGERLDDVDLLRVDLLVARPLLQLRCVVPEGSQCVSMQFGLIQRDTATPLGSGKSVTVSRWPYTQQIEFRIPICPRENLS